MKRKPRKSRIKNDLTGQHFGRWVVVRHLFRRGWLCRCTCGTEKIVCPTSLTSGRSKSCGCLHWEIVATKNGVSKNLNTLSEYRAWRGMISRCTNPKNHAWDDYGGRGIKVCKWWCHPEKGFDRFYKVLGAKPDPSFDLNRINNNGNYDLGNCEWTSRKLNNRNRRSNTFYTYKGEIKTLAEWAENSDLTYACIHQRLVRGWSFAKAISTPI